MTEQVRLARVSSMSGPRGLHVSGSWERSSLKGGRIGKISADSTPWLFRAVPPAQTAFHKKWLKQITVSPCFSWHIVTDMFSADPTFRLIGEPLRPSNDSARGRHR